jgi:hypothetical protein
MNLQDYKNMSHDELAYLAFCREPKARCSCDEEVYTFLRPFSFKQQEHFFAISTDVQHHVVASLPPLSDSTTTSRFTLAISSVTLSWLTPTK